MNVITKIGRAARLFPREEGPFGPRFYESGGVLKISPRVKLGGRSETAALPRRDSTPEALRRPAPDTLITGQHGVARKLRA